VLVLASAYAYMGNPRVDGPIGVEIEVDTLVVCIDGDLEMYGNWKYEWTPTGGEQTPPDPDEIAVTLANWSVNPSANVTLSPSSPCNPVTFNASEEGKYEVTLTAQPDFPGWDEQSALVTVLASDFILEVVDGNDSANFQFDAINADSPRPVLYVAKNAVDNDISVIMKAPEGSPCEYTSKFKYEVTGNQVTEGESDSGEGPHLVTLSPVTYPDDATFTVKAWYDADNSGDQNGSEPVRYIDVIVLKVDTETVATVPADRTRKKVGVGEPVTLTLQPTSLSPVSWSILGNGTLSATTGNPVTFTAHDRASTPSITATYGSGSCTVNFTVVEPSGAMIEQEAGTGIRHTTNTVSCGFKGRPYIQPDDVSFKNIAIREGTVAGVASGYLAPKNGEPHGAGTWPGASVGDVVVGKGSKVNGVDTISSGDYTWTPYADGIFTWSIPWYFRVGTGAEKQFTTVTHQETSDATGKLTIGKGGTTKSAALSDPTSSY